MKNIKIDDKTNDFLVKFAAVVGLSKRAFLGKLLENITPYELRKIFGRVLLNFGDEGVEYDDIDGDLPFEFEDEEDGPVEVTHVTKYNITLKNGKVFEYDRGEILYDEGETEYDEYGDEIEKDEDSGKHVMKKENITVFFDEHWNPTGFKRGNTGQLWTLNKDGYQV